MNILSFHKALPCDLSPEISFPFKSIDVMIDPDEHVLCVHQQGGELLSAIPLSPHEYAAMLVFYKHYPHYAPDTPFKEKGIKKNTLKKLSDKMHKKGIIAIERIRTTGYFLVEEGLSTSPPVENRMSAFSS